MDENPRLKDDIGYQETEEELARLENELQELYSVAASEAQETATEYLESMRQADEAMLKRVKDGIITEEDYKRWRLTHVLTAQRFQELADVLAADYLQTAMIAASVINGHMPEVYAINMNYETYKIETKAKISTSFTLYNRNTVERMVRYHPDLLPEANVNIDKQMRWSKQHINSAVTQGIMQGDSIDQIAERLRMVSDMDMRASIRNARTMTTSAQNGARMDALNRFIKMGGRAKRMWVATLDGKTRHWHRQMDGQKREMNEPFESDIGKIMFPGDPKAAPSNVYNCRCAVVEDDVEYPTDASDLSLRYSERLEGQDYWTWKNSDGRDALSQIQRNYKADADMFRVYKSLIGAKNAPKTLRDFQIIKYEKPDEWAELKKKAAEKRRAKKRTKK